MDAEATFSCSFTQSDLGPVTESRADRPQSYPAFLTGRPRGFYP